MSQTDRKPDSAASRKRNHPWSLYLLTVTGIPIYLHFTFLLMLLFIYATGNQIFGGVSLVLLVFLSIALHELGHALTARRYGIQTEDIVLYPIGGVARLRSLGEGWQEFWIALAGPMVNVIIAVVLFGLLAMTGNWMPMTEATIQQEGVFTSMPMLQKLMIINIVLVIFNLIPAFPMDGGRVLRAILSSRLSKTRATDIAAKIGQAMAILFMLIGLLGNPFLMFIGIFIFLAAGSEAAAVKSVALMEGRKARDAMITHFEVLQHGESLGRAADLLLASPQQDFPVMGGSDIIGVLGRKALIRGLTEHGRDHYIAEVMSREFPRMHPDDDLQDAFAAMRSADGLPIMIFDGDRMIGYINQDNLMEYLMVAQSDQKHVEREERAVS